MKQEIFEIILMLIKIGLLVISALLIPSIKKWIDGNMSEKQRAELWHWSGIGIKLAEIIFKEKGQGVLKKEFVLDLLAKNGIKVTPEQADIVINTIVDYFNRMGWNETIKGLME